MSKGEIQANIQSSARKGDKKFAVLIDPDDMHLDSLDKIIELSNRAIVDYFFIGGSHITNDDMDSCLERLKENSDIPLILFPGGHLQINNKADAILFLSLVSGRNPDLLIGQQVMSAPYLRKSSLEVISTAYMLIDGGSPTTASYISHSQPIPADKPKIASSTAIASEMLGFSQVYMDAGSGANNSISTEMIREVKDNISIPLIVGGGINAANKAYHVANAGADLIVVGNAIEKEPSLLSEISAAIKSTREIA